MQNKITTIKDLTQEPLLEIFSHLNIGTLLRIASVNKKFKNLVANQFIWKQKVKVYFPHLFNELITRENVDWYKEFRIYYKNALKKLPIKEARKFFSRIIKNDFKDLEFQNRLKKLLSYDQFGEDPDLKTLVQRIREAKFKSIISLIDLARELKIRPVLDYIFSLIQSVPKINMLYWHIITLQDLAKMKDLLDVANLDDIINTPYGKLHYIHIAAVAGHLDVIKKLIESTPELHKQIDCRGQTALVLAVANGHADIAEYLIGQGADPNVKPLTRSVTYHNKTALHWAAEKGLADVVTLLLENGAEETPKYGKMFFQPIHLAAKAGHLAVIQAFVEHNANIVEEKDIDNQTALTWAAAEGHADIVKYLISKGADKSVRTNSLNGGAMFWAAYNGPIRYHGRTPLHWAAFNGHSEVAKVLIKNDADYNVQTFLLETPLQVAKKEIKPKLELCIYSHKLKNDPSFTFFSKHKNKLVPIPKEEIKPALKALKQVAFGKKDPSELKPYENTLKQCEELKSFYRKFG